MFYWLQDTKIDLIEKKNNPLTVQSNINQILARINQKILKFRYKIPYPFNHKLYIKHIQFLGIVG